MVPILVALISCAAGLMIELAFLRRRDPALRAKEQAFQFHALRDELQLFVVEGRIGSPSLTYTFLMQMLNFSIKNAGALKLRDVLELVEKVKKRVDETRFEAILFDVKKYDPAVQELVANFFLAFANMLVSNDRIVRFAVAVARKIASSRKALKPVFETLLRLAPMRAEAVNEARRYRSWARCASPGGV